MQKEKKFTKEGLIEGNIIHQDDVAYLLDIYAKDITGRGTQHDYTKNSNEAVLLLRDCLNKDKPWSEWNNYHFKQESHHPEFYDDITDMSLSDLMEMVSDGAAACYRRSPNEPVYSEQVAHFFKKGFGEQMANLLAKEFMKVYDELKGYVEIDS